MSWHTVPAAPAFAVHGDHVQRWTALHGVSAASPLLAPEFVAAALAVFGTGRELLVWHTNDGAVDTMAIVTPTRFGVWETFQPAQAPVGLWLQRDSNAPVALLAGLLRALPGPALMLGLTQCDPMLIARAPDSATMRSTDYIQTARISIDSDFDSYWNARGKNLRANLKKQRARLRQDGVSTRLAISRAPHDMAQAVADYGSLETSGWKAAGGTAVGADNAQGRFYRALLEGFAAVGRASVYRYYLGEQLAAMDLCVEGGGCVVVLKTAYDEALGRQFSPALLMREEACRSLFDAGDIERIEFYGRVMEWHLRWTGEVRTMYHLNAYRWPGLARLHALARAT